MAPRAGPSGRRSGRRSATPTAGIWRRVSAQFSGRTIGTATAPVAGAALGRAPTSAVVLPPDRSGGPRGLFRWATTVLNQGVAQQSGEQPLPIAPVPPESDGGPGQAPVACTEPDHRAIGRKAQTMPCAPSMWSVAASGARHGRPARLAYPQGRRASTGVCHYQALPPQDSPVSDAGAQPKHSPGDGERLHGYS
jgi:hypothetical protein